MNKAALSPPLWKRLPLKSAIAVFVVLLLFWQIPASTYGKDLTTGSPGNFQSPHPIVKRMTEAKIAYRDLLERQSKDLDEAKKEYRKRYHRNPPEGFDEWYEYAVKHNSLIIDDFDTIEESLRPFRAYYRRGCALQLQEHKRGKFLQESRLLQTCVKDKNFTMIGDHSDGAIIRALRKLSLDFIDKLPEVCFNMNMADEPRSSLPYDTPKDGSTDSTFCPAITFVSYERQNWWAEAVLNCPPDSPARKFPGRPEPAKVDKFLKDFKSATDLCSHTSPVEHGLILRPSTLFQCHQDVPILSNAGLSTSSDVLFPSLYRYYEWGQYNKTEDLPWSEKSKIAYWRGSTTGGHNSLNGWHRLHRHRLVDFANKEENNIKKFTNVRFSKDVQCDEDTCKELKEHYDFDKEQKFGEVWRNKIALDVDGNGLSGRFYPLLRSNNAVFRQSIFREWHDSRIFPWAHYVPFSMELDDLPELLQFFLGTDEGDDLLHEIAKGGQEMAEAILRKEDIAIYWYRLLIEMGRKD